MNLEANTFDAMPLKYIFLQSYRKLGVFLVLWEYEENWIDYLEYNVSSFKAIKTIWKMKF